MEDGGIQFWQTLQQQFAEEFENDQAVSNDETNFRPGGKVLVECSDRIEGRLLELDRP